MRTHHAAAWRAMRSLTATQAAGRWRLAVLGVLLLCLIPAGSADVLAATRPATTTQLSRIRIAFTQDYNVYIMSADGSSRTVVTTRGSSPYARGHIWYPWYQWSPDGKYLLLVREQFSSTGYNYTGDLLLLDSQGNLIRTLAHSLPRVGVYPTWALDSDQIAYLSMTGDVTQIDVSGRTTGGYHVVTQGAGCGGGGPRPATLLLYRSETDYDGVPGTLSWSAKRSQAAIAPNCSSSVLVTKVQTPQTRPLFGRNWAEAALSQTGRLAVTYGQCGNFPYYEFLSCIGLVDVQSGNLRSALGQGELPRWSREGRSLYFVRSTPVTVLHMTGPVPYFPSAALDYNVYSTSILRANADGSRVKKIISTNACGVGMLHPTPDGRGLIFSLVDNIWNLYYHRSHGNIYDQYTFDLYGPRVSIRMLDLNTNKLTVLVRNAGRPEVQP